ncbi:MAG: BREX-3 system phosphatase PglZ [Woeseia sp.]|nr:BREX-3 system phosphatase PglZ [Woeseia sp.]
MPSSQCDALHEDIEERFAAWMHRNYASLHNLSPFLRPAMVHHIPQHLAQTAANVLTKHALIVVDGLALDQWVVLRDALIDQLGDKIKIEEDGSFAWVPTLTSVSRQAIFAGAEPMFFAESIAHTSKESAHWIRFWENHGAKRAEIGYVREGKNQSDDAFLRDVLEESERPKMRLLGVVVGKVDQSMHGAKTGSGGLHAVVRDWASGGAMAKLVDTLLSDGFEIIITADHGNVHAQGIGKPNVGVTADERGERAHVFRDELTRANTAEEFPGTIQWPQIGLPDDWRVLLAPGRGAFVPVGQQIIGHGGIAMEEVIVPFVKIHGAAS